MTPPTREDRMIYEGPGFLAVGSTPTPLPPFSRQQELPFFLSLPVCRRSSLLMGEGGRGKGAGVEPNHTTARKPGPL
jgi:hypothetical protein